MSNERGIALIITLLVVTLLTIAVVEFTFSVQVDQQLTHNALSAMQAAMLARSGIHVGEAVLARDANQPQADWYFEDWAKPDIASVIVLDPGQRLEVRVLDESGKININRTCPLAPVQPSPALGQLGKKGTGGQPGQQPNLSVDAFLRDALRRLFEAREIDVQIPDRLLDYWTQVLPPRPGQPQQAQALNCQLLGFRTLEDFGALFGIPSSKLAKLSKFLTALPSGPMPGHPGIVGSGGININTAPVEVLTAVINDADPVSRIVERQGQEDPIQPGELGQFFQGMKINDQPVSNQMTRLFGVTSSFFRIYASAMVNSDPTGRRLSGVGQTAIALVNRRLIPGVPPDAAAGVPRWTLTLFDWQKRGGAELLMPPQEPGAGRSAPNELG